MDTWCAKYDYHAFILQRLIKDATSLNVFKNRYKQYFMNGKSLMAVIVNEDIDNECSVYHTSMFIYIPLVTGHLSKQYAAITEGIPFVNIFDK